MQCDRGGDQDSGHHQLGDDRTDRGVDPCGAQVADGEAFVADGALLVEDHPGHAELATEARKPVPSYLSGSARMRARWPE